MNSHGEHLDVLQNLEAATVEVWRRNPDMSDSVAGRAYEAAYEFYRAEMRGHSPKTCSLTGLDREVFEALKAVCEWRAGRAALKDLPADAFEPVTASALVDCLRKLWKSVERHTKLGGRQGYLNFVGGFVP